jgi:hypothetical protein
MRAMRPADYAAASAGHWRTGMSPEQSNESAYDLFKRRQKALADVDEDIDLLERSPHLTDFLVTEFTGTFRSVLFLSRDDMSRALHEKRNRLIEAILEVAA